MCPVAVSGGRNSVAVRSTEGASEQRCVCIGNEVLFKDVGESTESTPKVVSNLVSHWSGSATCIYPTRPNPISL